MDLSLARALRKALDNIDPTPTIEVTSRDFPGSAGVVFQTLNAGPDGDGDKGESDSDRSEGDMADDVLYRLDEMIKKNGDSADDARYLREKVIKMKASIAL